MEPLAGSGRLLTVKGVVADIDITSSVHGTLFERSAWNVTTEPSNGDGTMNVGDDAAQPLGLIDAPVAVVTGVVAGL